MSLVYTPDNPPVSDDPRLLKEYLYRQLRRIADHFNTLDPFVYEPWDDLRFPAIGLRTPGSRNAPGVESTTGLPLFDGVATTEAVCGVAQLPHGWREQSYIRPHVHWCKTTTGSTGNVYWQLEYMIADVAEIFSGSFTTVASSTVADDTPDNDTAWEHLITSFGDIDMTGFKISAVMVWILSRLPGNAADTYGSDVRLLEFDIHYQADAQGSYKQFIKSL